MNKLALLLIFICLSISGYAQTAIKLYQNLDYEINPQAYVYGQSEGGSSSDLHVSRTSLALQFGNSKKYFHEVELSYAENAIPIVHEVFPQTDYYETTNNYFGIQYELNKRLAGSGQFFFSVGGGFLLYHLTSNQEAVTDDRWNRKQHYTGGLLQVIPRLQYQISKKLFADLNLKLALFDIQRFETYVDAPMLPVRKQTEVSTETAFFPSSYTVRLGLGFRL